MLTKRLTYFLNILIISLGITACEKKEPSATNNDNPSEIIAVNAPLQYFTQRLAADLTRVTLIAPGESDPAEWQPNIEEVLRLQQAELVVLNGAGYSNWLDKVAISSAKLINTSQTFSQRYIELSNQSTHSHGPTAEHSHGALAFTTWMDIDQAIQQAQAITQALEKRWPEETKAIRQREAQLLAELTKLDEAYQQQTKRFEGKTIIYSHPVYQYFERRYQLPGTSLHWEPNDVPSENAWLKLEIMLGNTDNTLFIWEDHPSAEIKARMKAMKLRYVVINPAANTGSDSWLQEQQENIKRLASCCKPS